MREANAWRGDWVVDLREWSWAGWQVCAAAIEWCSVGMKEERRIFKTGCVARKRWKCALRSKERALDA